MDKVKDALEHLALARGAEVVEVGSRIQEARGEEEGAEEGGLLVCVWIRSQYHYVYIWGNEQNGIA